MRRAGSIRRSLEHGSDALVMHLYGGELSVAFEDAREMLKAVDALRSPVWAGSVGQRPVALYLVPKAAASSSGRAATIEAAQSR